MARIDRLLVPTRLCECGCGRDAGRYSRTSSKRGRFAGAPRRRLPSHGRRIPEGGRDLCPRNLELRKAGYETPCLVWVGDRNPGGYGVARDASGHQMTAHTLIWWLAFGPIPAKHEVHHLCRNRACVHPAHLRMHSTTDHRRLHQAKLTVEQVQELRSNRLGYDFLALAREHGISPMTLVALYEGRSWSEIKPLDSGIEGGDAQ
jgi:hypothetical protein